MPLMPSFTADYPGAIVVPATLDNVYSPTLHGGIPNAPRAWVLHTPEEKADDIEVTPRWFQQYHPESRGSTHYYLDNDGDVYQCVDESWGAIANGFNPGVPQQVHYPSWAGPFSLNWQTVSVEIEGFAHNIGQTLNDVQFNSLVRLVKHRAAFYRIPLLRSHIIGHYQVAFDRTDPGQTFPWARLMAALKEEEPMTPEEKAAFEALAGAVRDIRLQLNDYANISDGAIQRNDVEKKEPPLSPKGLYFVAGKRWPF